VPSSNSASAGTNGAMAPGSAGTVEPAAASAGISASDADASGAELTPGQTSENVGPVSARTRSTSGQVTACGANVSLSPSGQPMPTCPTTGDGGSAAAAPATRVSQGRASGSGSTSATGGSGSSGFMTACSPAVGFAGAARFEISGCSPDAAGARDGFSGAGNRRDSANRVPSAAQPDSGASGRDSSAASGRGSSAANDRGSSAANGRGSSAANGQGGSAQTVLGMCMQGARRSAEFLPLALVVGAAALAGWLLGARRSRSTSY
jgi:hypothetical protein